MILRLAPFALVSVWSLPLAAGDYAPGPFILNFADGSAELDEEAKAQLDALTDVRTLWPDHEVYDCSLTEPIDPGLVAQRADSIDEYIGIALGEVRGRNSVDLCSLELEPWLIGDIPEDGHLIALLSARDINQIYDGVAFRRADYVPDNGWPDDHDEAWKAPFYEGWFGDHLDAMGEPSFAPQGNLKHFESRLRITAYPEHLPAYGIRIDERTPGEFVIYWSLLDGAGGYEPGQIFAKGSRRLTSDEAEKLVGLRRAVNFPIQSMDDGDMEPGNVICLGGTRLTFEKLDSDGRSFLNRGFCGYSDETLSALREFSVGLTDGKLMHALEEIRLIRFGED